jgi:hypothetical protein
LETCVYVAVSEVDAFANIHFNDKDGRRQLMLLK